MTIMVSELKGGMEVYASWNSTNVGEERIRILFISSENGTRRFRSIKEAMVYHKVDSVADLEAFETEIVLCDADDPTSDSTFEYYMHCGEFVRGSGAEPVTFHETRDVWNDDSVQFPRLLGEIRAVIDFTPAQKKALCDSMDLEWERIDSLLERGDEVWHEMK